jgi:hypothetical protein
VIIRELYHDSGAAKKCHKSGESLHVELFSVGVLNVYINRVDGSK